MQERRRNVIAIADTGRLFAGQDLILVFDLADIEVIASRRSGMGLLKRASSSVQTYCGFNPSASN